MKYSPKDARAMAVRSEADRLAWEALRPVLDAGRPARLRLLRVVCARSHRLVDVYATARGPVYVADTGVTWGGIDGAEDGGRHESRAHPTVGELRYLDALAAIGLPTDQVRVAAQCRCQSAAIPLSWLGERINTPSRRAVWAPTAPMR